MSSTTLHQHDDLSSEDFLRRVKTLTETKDREDRQRAADLEKDIIQSREQRKARRADRARSLSNTPQSLETPLPTASASPITADAPKMANSPESPTSLARSGTLSWQQRRRPLSVIAAENNLAQSPKATPTTRTTGENEPSRADIAESLGMKDPSWFKQTADRGIGSAAYRRNQEDIEDNNASVGRFRLPGLPQGVTAVSEGTMTPPSDATRSISPSRTNSIRGSAGWNNRYSSATSASDYGSGTRSPALEPPKLTPSTSDMPAPSTSRPSSPTKGMGGFVQSAMMKRSDSVNKRWSAAAGPGLSRQDSTASNRSGYSGRGDVSGNNMPRFDARPSSLSKGDSLEPASRPSSSHSNQTITPQRNETQDAAAARSGPSLHSRSKSTVSLRNISETGDDTVTELSPPPSPSKRWSPTKSSWLESKLSKTEEKASRSPVPAQPSWMENIAKVKQQRLSASIDDPPKLPSEPVLLRTPSPELKTQPPLPVLMASSSAPEPSPKPSKWTANDTTPQRSLRKSPPPPSPANSPKPSDSKPSVPAKIDFRANLKSRSTAGDNAKSEEPEFKNVFGKLRRTQTEKFVAPDTLKDNILRGKAGLNLTGGPAKRERVDELKESLIKQKEAMKVKAAAPDTKRTPEKPKDNFTPEALLKRNALNRAKSSESGAEKKVETPEALQRQRSLGEKPKPLPPLKPSSPLPTKASSIVSDALRTAKSPQPTPTKTTIKPTLSREVDQMPAGASRKLAGRFNPALADLLARGPPAVGSTDPKSPSSTASKDGVDGPPKESAQLTHMTKARARGPKRRAPKTAEVVQPATEAESEKSPVPTGELIPSAQPTVEKIPVTKPKEEPMPLFAKKLESTIQSRPLPTPPKTQSIVGATQMGPPRIPKDSKFDTDTAQSPKPSGLKPAAPTKSPLLSSKQAPPTTLSSPPKSQRVHSPAREVDSALGAFNFSDDSDVPSSKPFTVDIPLRSKVVDQRVPSPARSPERSPERPSSISVKGVASRWDSTAESPTPSSPGRAKSPVKLPTRLDEEKAMVDAGLRPSQPAPEPLKKPAGLGLGLSNITPHQSAGSQSQLSPRRFPLSPPSSAGLSEKPSPTVFRDVTTPASLHSATESRTPDLPSAKNQLKSPSSNAPTAGRSHSASKTLKVHTPESPVPHTSEAARLFAEFFDSEPTISSMSDLDVLKILDANPLDTPKVKTLSNRINEISGGGKLVPLPNHQEHVLFEDSMYVCVHTFEPAKGPKATEVYLWSGHEVAPAALEDAQLFARKVAKDNGGKLIVIRQGKETPYFFQALGGIVITFRGGRSKTSTTGLPDKYMLCGRRHLGHIAFDEVDFNRTSFCTGFPFLISANSTLYLWKGDGCSAEELGCARLIAMDLGPSPDVLEISAGSEPASFLSLFPLSPTAKSKSMAIPPSASHWRLKPSLGDKYRARLFRVEQRPVGARMATTPRKSNAAFQVSSFFGRWSPLPSPVATSYAEQLPKTIILSSVPPSPAAAPGSTAAATDVQCTIEEITPFSRDDIDGEAVWVLDAFFEVYIILSPLSTTQPRAFSTALVFAQDYGILAASADDRPFVPVSTVVVDGAPRDMRAVFRRWRDRGRDEHVPTARLMDGKRLVSGGGLRVVGLAAALAAVQRGC